MPRKKMSKKSLANLRPAKKGEVRNPEGGRTHDPEKRKLAALTRKELAEVGTVVVSGSLEELNEIRKDKTKSVLQHWIAAIASDAIKRNAVGVLDQLMNRIVGPVEQQFNHKGIPPAAASTPTVVILPAKKNSDGT